MECEAGFDGRHWPSSDVFVAAPEGAPLYEAPHTSAKIRATLEFRALVRVDEGNSDGFCEVTSRDENVNGFMDCLDLTVHRPLSAADMVGQFKMEDNIRATITLKSDGTYAYEVPLCSTSGQILGSWDIGRIRRPFDYEYTLILEEKSADFSYNRPVNPVVLPIWSSDRFDYRGGYVDLPETVGHFLIGCEGEGAFRRYTSN